MHSRCLQLFVVACLSLSDVRSLHAGDWPRFLGPTGDGVSTETDLRTDWPEDGLPKLWSVPIGTGYSAPSVRGDRLVVHHRLKGEEIVECFSAKTGESQWKTASPTRYRDPYGYNDGPRCTPILTEDHVYTYGAEGKLTCLTLAEGKQIWQRDVKADFTIPKWFFGIGCTPVIAGELVIALVGGQPNAAVVAFDRMTGKTAWARVGKETWDGAKTGWEREPTYDWTGTEMTISYSTPTLATFYGEDHLLCLVRQGLVSLDPKTGDERFHIWFRSRKYESVNAARPVVIGNRVLISATYELGAMLIEVQPPGEPSPYKILWDIPDNLQAHWSTPIHVDGYVYGFSGRHESGATLRCIELDTGKVRWETNGFEGDLNDLGQDPNTGRLIDSETGKPIPWPFYGRGSKIQIGERFIVLGERGTLALVRVTPERWIEEARFAAPELEAPTWTAPVLADGRLFLRDEDSLVCLDLSRPE